MDRQPPSNIEAEQKLLGAIIYQNLFLYDCIHVLKPDHFSDEIHRDMYDKMINLADSGRKYDVTGLGQHFKTIIVNSELDGAEYIHRLAGSAHGADVADLSKTIIDCYKRREVIGFCSNAVDRAYISINDTDLISDVQNDLESIVFSEDGETVVNINTITDEILRKAQDENRDYGVPTGIKAIDDIIGGCPKSDVTIIGGRSSMGKTALAVSMFKNQIEQKYNGIFFSLEMSTEQLASRLLCSISYNPNDGDRNWNYSNLLKWGLRGSQFKALQRATRHLDKLDYLVNDQSGLTVAQMASYVRKKKRELNKDGKTFDFIYVDHIILAKASDRYSGNETSEVSEISKQLKALAKKENIAVIALSQVNRGTEGRDNKRPRISDLKQSGGIEQDAGVVLLCYRKDYYVSRERPAIDDENAMSDWAADMRDCQGKYEVIIAKERNGQTKTVDLLHKIEFNHFESA